MKKYASFIIFNFITVIICDANIPAVGSEGNLSVNSHHYIESKEIYVNYTSTETDSFNITDGDIFSGYPLPIIIYGMANTDEAFAQVKKWGATHVHRYGMGRSVERDQDFFDRAADHGLKVMSDLRANYWLKDENDINSFHDYVQHFKDHPALGFWYLCDEPDNKGYSPRDLVPFYKIIREETPNVPVALAHAWSKNWYRYGNVQDVLMYDYYPIEGESFPNGKLDSWTRFTQSAINRSNNDKDAVVPVLQMFNWKAMAQEGQEKVRGHAVEKLRYPGTEELRYMAFTSVALGANGLSFFSYYRSRMVDRNWAGRVLAPVIHEAKAFVEEVDDAKIQHVRQAEGEMFFITFWECKKAIFIMLVNARPNVRQVQQSLGGIIDTGNLEPWGQTRETEVSLRNGRIKVEEVEPWEVLIWSVNPP